jgi:cytochrome c biogenesis protein CcmG, thiol:disulfide interchange protein DsbE
MRARWLVAGLVLAGLLSGCTSDADGSSDDGGARPAPSAQAAPSLAACAEQPDTPAGGADLLPALSFDCPGGGSLDLGRAPGAPTVVNLWGSWCAPCREEMPLLQEFADGAGERVRVVGVISKDGLPQAESFAADAGIEFPSAFDGEGELMTELGLNALPYTYLVDADGGLAYSHPGPVTSVDELRDLVAEHLGVQL